MDWKTWAEVYKIKMIDRASEYVEPDEDFQLEEEEDQDVEEEELEPEEDESEVIQVSQSHAEELTETQLVWLVMSKCLQEQEAKLQQVNQFAARTRQALGASLEMSAFADVKDDKTLNEWLHGIAFVTSTMSHPDELKSFQEAWPDPDLIARGKW